MERLLTEDRLERFEHWLKDEAGASEGTVRQYLSRMETLREYLGGEEMTTEALEGYRSWLVGERRYKASSANTYLFPVRRFCDAMDWEDVEVEAYRPEPHPAGEEKYIRREDYMRLVRTALDGEQYRLAMVIQVLCHMDLRFTELKLVTAEAVKAGYIRRPYGEGGTRQEFPGELREALLGYLEYEGTGTGFLFRSSKGNVPDRSNTWRELKRLCGEAGVDVRRVNLRKLKSPGVGDYYPVYGIGGGRRGEACGM